MGKGKIFECLICGKEFKGYRPDRKTCSKKCQGEYFKTALKGKNNPNYRDGKHLDIFCKCGNTKDYRAKVCLTCYNAVINLSEEIIRQAAKTTTSYHKMGLMLGIARSTAKRLVSSLDIDISHFRPGRNRPTPLEDIFIKGKRRINGTVKRLLLENNILEYVCFECEVGPFWNGKELILQLHHKNGDGCDNRLENLQFLCPNCHSQTVNFTGKNIVPNIKKGD